MPEGVHFYKGCAIVRSGAYVTVRRGTRDVRAELHRVKGTVEKSHSSQPWLTSVTEAKRYITAEIDARTYGRSNEEV